MERAVTLLDIERAAERPFGARFAQDSILHRRQASPPFFFAKFDLVHGRNVGAGDQQVKRSGALIHQIFTMDRPECSEMYRYVTLGLAALLVLAQNAPLWAQSGASSFDEAAGSVQRLNVEIRTQLDFSRATTTGKSGGKIRVDPQSGASSVTGDVVELGASALAGTATVTGEPGRAVRIEMPESIRMTSAQGGTIRIVNLRTNLPPAPRLDAFGKLEFAFGGDLMLEGNVAGSFRGRIPITAEYE
jgi:Domain of unknown function (DUF4402)